MLLATLMTVLVLAGCARSDTITQTIYDNNEEGNVDRTQVVMLNDINAEEETMSLPKLQESDDLPDKQDQQQTTPKYGDGNSVLAAARPMSATAQTVADTSAEGNASDRGNNATEEETQSPNSGASSSEVKSETPEAQEPEGEKDEEKGEGDTPKAGAGKNVNNEVKIYTDYGEFPEIPEGIKHVTAVGQAAVIVSALGGTAESTPLEYADAALLGNASAQTYLANKGIGKVSPLWTQDGASEDLADIEVLRWSDVDLCFVMAGDNTFTAEQKQVLLEANIIVYELPAMASASKIKFAVDIVGQILAAGGNEQAGRLSQQYLDYHGTLVDKFKDLNGGITGGFNFDTSEEIATDATKLASLYISDWDYSASYNDDNGYLNTTDGIGVARLGYSQHPLAYYMSVGGAINNASSGDFRAYDGYSSVVWQFSTSQAPLRWAHWTSLDRAMVNEDFSNSQGLDYALLWSKDVSAGLGTLDFPGVVVANRRMAEAMGNESKAEHGVYYPYPLTKRSTGGVVAMEGVGFDSGSNLIFSAIGKNAMGTSDLNDGTTTKLYKICVNPNNGFASWTDGSMESILEVPWIYSQFRNVDYDATSDLREFYKTFYSYDLSDAEVKTIMAGAEG